MNIYERQQLEQLRRQEEGATPPPQPTVAPSGKDYVRPPGMQPESATQEQHRKQLFQKQAAEAKALRALGSSQ